MHTDDEVAVERRRKSGGGKVTEKKKEEKNLDANASKMRSQEKERKREGEGKNVRKTKTAAGEIARSTNKEVNIQEKDFDRSKDRYDQTEIDRYPHRYEQRCKKKIWNR